MYANSTLVYRATSHGWNTGDFHRMADNKGPTLTIIRNKANGKIAGGYTAIPWATVNGYVADPNAYLFSVDRKEKYTVKNVANALFDHVSYGATYGNGHDIHVANVPQSNANSYANLGVGYDLPAGVTAGSTEAKEMLFGVYNFQPDEIEIFSLTNF